MSTEGACFGAVQKTRFAATAVSDHQTRGKSPRFPVLNSLLQARQFLFAPDQETPIVDWRDAEQEVIESGQLMLRLSERERVAQCGTANHRFERRLIGNLASEKLERPVPSLGGPVAGALACLPALVSDQSETVVQHSAAAVAANNFNPSKLR